MVNIIPSHHIVPATGAGSTNGEDEPLVKGFPEQFQDLPSFRGVRKVGCSGHSVEWLARVWMLLLQTVNLSFYSKSHLEVSCDCDFLKPLLNRNSPSGAKS